MTRIRILQTCALGAATLLATASVALAQPQPMPPPPPPGTPEPPPPPPPPATEVAPMSPLAAATMPKSPDDMTGSIGFGIGIGSSSQLLSSAFADTATSKQVAVRYWTSDTLVLQPSLLFALNKTSGVDANWTLAPEFVALFVPVRGTSTRLLVGGGLGIVLNKTPPNDTTFMFYLPIQAGVEHFFTRWFSLGPAARTHFFQMATGDPWNIQMTIANTSLMGSAFIYTD
jgi:hypothetical protein